MTQALIFLAGVGFGSLAVGIIDGREWLRIRAVLRDARRIMRNAVGAVETNQVEDKDVRGMLWAGIHYVDKELNR